MKLFQQRVVEEKDHLDTKLAALDTFIEGKVFDSLPQDEKARLTKQRSLMKQYSAVLEDRITSFE